MIEATELLSNRPLFVRLTHVNAASHQQAKATTIKYSTLSEDERDKLLLVAAADKYAGRDWSEYPNV